MPEKGIKNKYLVLDIGGSSIKYALMDEKRIMYEKGKKGRPRDEDSFIAAIHDLYQQFQAEAKGIAISMPGIIDSEKGIAHTGGALRYIKDFPITAVISQLCRVPVWVGNDAKCAGIAEVGYGALKDIQDGMVIVFGTGIGGCIIVNREVRQGRSFCAGEFSNICVDESRAYQEESRWASVNGIRGLQSCVQRHLGEAIEMTGEEIFQQAEAGNEKIMAALAEFCHQAAVQIFNLQAIFDGEKIAIGGGISAQPLFIQLLREKLKGIYECGVPVSAVMPDIVPCKYLNDANLVGALHQLLSQSFPAASDI